MPKGPKSNRPDPSLGEAGQGVIKPQPEAPRGSPKVSDAANASDGSQDVAIVRECAADHGHTPGPWVEVDTQIQAGDGTVICSLPKRRDGAGNWTPTSEWQADAIRMLLAAPEAYAVCLEVANGGGSLASLKKAREMSRELMTRFPFTQWQRTQETWYEDGNRINNFDHGYDGGKITVCSTSARINAQDEWEYRSPQGAANSRLMVVAPKACAVCLELGTTDLRIGGGHEMLLRASQQVINRASRSHDLWGTELAGLRLKGLDNWSRW